jgi:hypothetical protein
VGLHVLEAEELATFRPTEQAPAPDADAYLLLDPDPEPRTLNDPPAVAVPRILAAGRSPLTVEEGLAVVAQRPEVLSDESCFSLAGSRCGDRRVPALWLSAQRPRLGWCWQGAPHTWRGTASCAGRLAVEQPRAAAPQDAAAMAEVYRAWVEQSAVPFVAEPPDPAEMARRMDQPRRLPWLVAGRLRYVGALAAITLPNPASVRLHEALGFDPVGVFREVGHKVGRWQDVGWWRLALRSAPVDLAGPLSWDGSLSGS